MRPSRLVLIPALLLSVTACADDSSSSGDGAQDSSSSPPGAAPPTSDAYDPQPYCDATRRLEAAGEKAFSGLGRDASPADYQAAERSFVLDNAELLDELVAAAPPDLTADVETLLTAMRQRGGLEDGGVTQREASQAEKRILAFEKRHC